MIEASSTAVSTMAVASSTPVVATMAASSTPVPATAAAKEPIVLAESGDAAAQTGQSESALVNQQVSAGLVGGGDGSVTVQNQSQVTIDRTGDAAAQSGISVALTSDPSLGGAAATANPRPEGPTYASTGDSSATGVQSQNVVTNQAQALVQVGGESYGEVTVQSSNQVAITEWASSDAASGSAQASQGTAVPLPVSVPSIPGTAGVGAAGTSAPSTSTGLMAQTGVEVSTDLIVTPQPDATGTLTVQESQRATIKNVGVAVASSDGACAGAGCPQPTKVGPQLDATQGSGVGGQGAGIADATPPALSPAAANQVQGPALASSGSAEATGLVANNVVNTDAKVRVSVQGENRGFIRVLIETITQIVNIGRAVTGSGEAVAEQGGASPQDASGMQAASVAAASSGEAEAKGAQVDNQVDMNTSASVRVAGDNRNPIYLVVDLFARITNLAFGWAASGNAQATGASPAAGQAAEDGGWAATSGAARATGLDAQNRVNMAADASVDIEGSNYADIYVRVRFHTVIENYGEAYAFSGKAQAVGAPAPAATSGGDGPTGGESSSLSSAGSGSASSEGSGGSSSVTRSGDATSLGHTSMLSMVSQQVASANGGNLPDLGWALPNSGAGSGDPSGGWTAGSRPGGSSGPQGGASPSAEVVGDVHSQSGDASSSGWDTTSLVVNQQVASSANPDNPNSIAENYASYNERIQGSSSSRSGFAGINATPTPPPTDTEVPAQKGGEQQGERGSESEGNHVLNARLEVIQVSRVGSPSQKPFQSLIKVGLPARWPSLVSPPMPDQRASSPGDLPAESPEVAGSLPRVSARPAGPVGGSFTRAQDPASAAFADIDPMAAWPELESPLLPGQTARQAVEDQDAQEWPAAGTPEGGNPMPLSLLFWGMATGLALVLLVSRRGRAWIVGRARQFRAAVQAFLSLMLH